MHQPIASLDLPEYLIEEFNACGLNYCKDVDLSGENTESKIDSVNWQKLNAVPKTKTALDLYNDECLYGPIPTQIQNLDDLLGGGIAIGQITELCGTAGAGKTQLCLQLCVNVQLPLSTEKISGEAVYVCTNNGFSTQRLKEFAEATLKNWFLNGNQNQNDFSCINDLSVDGFLRKVHYLKINDCVELLAFTKYLKNWLQNHTSVRLVVIDDISSPLKQIEVQERNFIVYKILQDLQELAEKYHFAVVLTNDVTTQISPEGSTSQVPSLGGSYYHRINARILLSRSFSNMFKATILKNVLCNTEEINFQLLC